MAWLDNLWDASDASAVARHEQTASLKGPVRLAKQLVHWPSACLIICHSGVHLPPCRGGELLAERTWSMCSAPLPACQKPRMLPSDLTSLPILVPWCRALTISHNLCHCCRAFKFRTKHWVWSWVLVINFNVLVPHGPEVSADKDQYWPTQGQREASDVIITLQVVRPLGSQFFCEMEV